MVDEFERRVNRAGLNNMRCYRYLKIRKGSFDLIARYP